MKKLKKEFIAYIKKHSNEFKYKVEPGHYNDIYIFTIPSQDKFLGIFPINLKFATTRNPQDIIDGVYNYLPFVDISTVFWKGIRLYYPKDIEILNILFEIFKETYKRYINKKRLNQFSKLIDLTKKK